MNPTSLGQLWCSVRRSNGRSSCCRWCMRSKWHWVGLWIAPTYLRLFSQQVQVVQTSLHLRFWMIFESETPRLDQVSRCNWQKCSKMAHPQYSPPFALCSNLVLSVWMTLVFEVLWILCGHFSSDLSHWFPSIKQVMKRTLWRTISHSIDSAKDQPSCSEGGWPVARSGRTWMSSMSLKEFSSEHSAFDVFHCFPLFEQIDTHTNTFDPPTSLS